MRTLKAALAATVAVAVSGCMTVEDTATRNAPLDSRAIVSTAGSTTTTTTAPAIQAGVPAPQTRSLQFTGFTVDVPPSLRVSEANSFYPTGDIVWRGEPFGDRHAQVASIVSDATRRAFGQTEGATRAVAELKVTRFHALTEKARYTTGGWHEINFVLTVRNADTGALIDGPRMIKTRTTAFGGYRAMEAEAQGMTERVRIVGHLANVLRQEVMGLGPLPLPVERAAPAASSGPVYQPL